jgi:tocopherol O-methyltransferase
MIECDIDTKDIQSHYDRLSFLYRTLWGDHIHHGYWSGDESSPRAQVRLIERLVSFARIPRGARVLDVGCGIGGSSVWLAKELGCTVTGLTISPAQMKLARDLARREGVEHAVSFEVRDANDLSLEERFDVVWVIECTEHLRDKAAFVHSAKRLLHPSGTLAFCAWLVAADLTPQLRQLAMQVCDGMLCPSLASTLEYQSWLSAAGFQDIRAEQITSRVQQTWDRCSQIAQRPEIQRLLRATDEKTRKFVAAFDAIRRAYVEGAMEYGMFAATSAG